MTILRDPVERIISLLQQLRRGAAWRDPSRPAPMATLALEEIYEKPDVYETLAHNHQTKLFSLTPDDAPTGYMQVVNVDDAWLAVAKQNLARVDVVGLTERYDQFLQEVVRRLGWRVRSGRG